MLIYRCVGHRSTANGAAIRGWQCCCEGHTFPCNDNCGDNKENANQAYDIDLSTGSVLTSKAMGSKCLVPSQQGSPTDMSGYAGARVVTQSCTGAESNNSPRIVYVAASIPHLRLSTNLSLCLEISKTVPPAPPPGPPHNPYIQVPQVIFKFSAMLHHMIRFRIWSTWFVSTELHFVTV